MRINEDTGKEIKRYSDVYSDERRNQGWWYFTTHGVQPGSVPKGVNILEVRDTPNGTYFRADAILNTSELEYYDIKERVPKEEESLNKKSVNTKINIRESLNKIDLRTDNKYDLRNLYESCILSDDEKRIIAKMISKNTSANVLYETLMNKFEGKSLKEDYSDKVVIFKELGKFRATPESNYNSRIRNERKVQKLDDFDSVNEIMDYYIKYGWADSKDDFKVIDESLNESKVDDYLESDLAEKSDKPSIKDAYERNNLTIEKYGGFYYIIKCPTKIYDLVKREMKKFYPDLKDGSGLSRRSLSQR